MKKFLLILLIFIALYFSGRIFLAWTRPNSNSNVRVSLKIPQDSSLTKISKILHGKELIRDPWAFKLYCWKNKISTKFRAGEFIIQKNLNYSEITEVLQHAKSSELKVTIPEGSTIKQIDKILAKKSLIKPGEFENCTNFCDLGFRIANLEGFLWPSTYYVNPKNFTAKKFIIRLYNNFQAQIQPFKNQILQSGQTLNETVIVASMIEREANTNEEMAKISGIIWKRLKEKIVLGIDATTRYEKGDWKLPLTSADFKIKSPYNTRRKQGLPPTAISNPGLKALQAAINPEKTEYYYYLHDRHGKIHFAVTPEQHTENKKQYIW